MPMIEFRIFDGPEQILLESSEIPSPIHIAAKEKERALIRIAPEAVGKFKEKIEEMRQNHPGFIMHILDEVKEEPGGNLFYKHTTLFPIENRIERFTSSLVTLEDIEPYTDGDIGKKYDENEAVSPLV